MFLRTVGGLWPLHSEAEIPTEKTTTFQNKNKNKKVNSSQNKREEVIQTIEGVIRASKKSLKKNTEMFLFKMTLKRQKDSKVIAFNCIAFPLCHLLLTYYIMFEKKNII